jgi:5-aminopentanamidase
MDVAFGDFSLNALFIHEQLGLLANKGVQLAVFPECCLTGYCVSNRKDAEHISISNAKLHEFQATCDLHNITAILGFAEFGDDGKLYNTVALIEPKTRIRFYRKTHLPLLGFDRFVTAGDEIRVFETWFGKVGILICFDLRAPEATRSLALQGADIICLPTNWPNGAQASRDTLSSARAIENKVFFVTCNRVGNENGFEFIGGSRIISQTGETLAQGEFNRSQILISDIEIGLARDKTNVTIPGEYETTVFESRRPDLYTTLLG